MCALDKTQPGAWRLILHHPRASPLPEKTTAPGMRTSDGTVSSRTARSSTVLHSRSITAGGRSGCSQPAAQRFTPEPIRSSTASSASASWACQRLVHPSATPGRLLERELQQPAEDQRHPELSEAESTRPVFPPAPSTPEGREGSTRSDFLLPNYFCLRWTSTPTLMLRHRGARAF